MPLVGGGPALAKPDHAPEPKLSSYVYDRGALAAAPAESEAPKRLLSAIDELARLQLGWDSYGGRPVSEATLKIAKALIERIYQAASALGMMLPEARVQAAGNGAVGFFWKHDARDADLELIVTEDELEYVTAEGDEIREGAIESLEDVLALLQDQIVAA